MSDDDKSNNLYVINGGTPPNAEARTAMANALTRALLDVGSGEIVGTVLVTVTKDGYQINWAGAIQPVPLAGILEVAKAQVCGNLIAAQTKKP